MYNNLEDAQKAVTHLNNQIVAKAIEVSARFQFLLMTSAVKHHCNKELFILKHDMKNVSSFLRL